MTTLVIILDNIEILPKPQINITYEKRANNQQLGMLKKLGKTIIS